MTLNNNVTSPQPTPTLSSILINFDNIAVTPITNVYGGRYIVIPTTPGLHNYNFSSDYKHCTYSQDFQITVSGASTAPSSSFDNLNRQNVTVISDNKEGCRNDEVKYVFNLPSSTTMPYYLSAMGANNIPVLIPLYTLNSVNESRDYSRTSSLALITGAPAPPNRIDLPNVAYYFKDNNQITLYLKLFDEIKTGPLKIHFNLDYSANGINSVQSLGVLNVNSPIVDFTSVQDLYCSKDTIIFAPNQTNGIFTARQVDLNLSTSAPLYNAADFDLPSTTLVTIANAFNTNNQFLTSVLSFGANNEKAGLLVEISYKHTPKYSDGIPCRAESAFTKTKIFPIFNNNDVNFVLPPIEVDPDSNRSSNNWVDYILNQNAIITPSLDSIIPNIKDRVFSGQWIQTTTVNGDVMQEAIEQITAGSYTINMRANNHGCIINGVGELKAVEKTAFQNLPPQLCLGAGAITFKRPTYASYTVSTAYASNTYIYDSATGSYSYIINSGYDYVYYSLNSILVNNLTTNQPLEVIPSTSSKITNVDQPNETITIDFDDYIRRGLISSNHEIEIVAIFDSRRRTYYPDSVASTSYNYYLPAGYSVGDSSVYYTNRTAQICKFDIDNVATFINVPSTFCASSPGLDIETNPTHNAGSSNYRLSLNGSSATSNWFTNHRLDANVFQNVLNMDMNNTSRTFTLEYKYQATPNCITQGSTLINYVSNTPAQVYSQGTSILTPIEVCKTGQPIMLLSNQSNVTLTNSAITLSNGQAYFNPLNSIVISGPDQILTSYIDSYGCSHTGSVNVEIKTMQNISLMANSNPINGSSYTVCENIGNITLGASYNNAPIANAGIGNGVFKVNNVPLASNILNTHSYVSGINTPVDIPVEFSYNANDGCNATTTVNLSIKPSPHLSLHLASIGSPALPLGICPNESAFWIIGLDNQQMPSGSHQFKAKGFGSVSLASDTILNVSQGLYSIVNSLARTPNPTRTHDTLVYVNTNSHGCTDSVLYSFEIKPLPIINVNNLDIAYCGNASISNLIVSPLPSDPSVSTFSFRGVGVTNNSTLPDIVTFNANTAYAAGLTSVEFKYIVEASNSCIDTFEQAIQIKPLPQVSLSLPQDNKMCINSLPHLMNVTTIGTTNSYTITSDIIRRDIQGIDTTYFIDPSLLNTSFIPSSTYYISVSSVSSDNCTNTQQESIIINDIPDVELRGMDSYHYLCTNGAQLVVEGMPIGNTNNSYFTPSINLDNYFSRGSGSRANIVPDISLANLIETVSYTYTDANNCSNTVTKEITFLSPPEIQITTFPISACQVYNDSIRINATSIPTAATNLQLSGQGIVSSGIGANRQWYFKAFAAQSGPQTITFTASQTIGSTTCTETTTRDIQVNPLPVPTIVGIRNDTILCNTNPIIPLSASGLNVHSMIFSGAGVDTLYTLTPIYGPHPSIPGGYVVIGNDTARSYVLNPDNTNASTIRQYLGLTALSDSGCVDSIRIAYDVYRAPDTYFEAPIIGFTTENNNDTLELCESEPSIVFLGYPGNGEFTRTYSMATASTILGPVYTPNPIYVSNAISSVQYDTIFYNVTTGNVCHTADTLVIKVNPIPRPTLTLGNFATNVDTIHVCKKDEALLIHTNPIYDSTTGALTGLGSNASTEYFYPSLTNLGFHKFRYTYTDPITQCSYFDEVTIRVSSTPVVSLTADPACENSSIDFIVTMDSLEVSIDNITGILWNFGDNINNNITVADSTTLRDNITVRNQTHYYTTSGIYQASLTVVNNDNCEASDTFRVVVSPKYTIGGRGNPVDYIEDFEGTNITWVDEKKGANTESYLWELTDLLYANRIPNTNGNKVWATTQTIPYDTSSGGWVYSPCFDISAMERPMISLDYFIDTDTSGKDGAVVEYYNSTSNQWEPLGKNDRGLNWYNSTMINGAPGEQTMAPIGWSKQSSEWKTGRYALDRFKDIDDLRFRVAFGASSFASNNLNGFEGFAFDNFKILDRDKNVLLFHFAEADQSVDRIVYDHVYGELNYPYDVNLMQVHYLDHDPVFRQNMSSINSISNFYRPSSPNVLSVDGVNYEIINNGIAQHNANYISRDINIDYYEKRILLTPHFFIDIEPIAISTTMNNRYSYTYTVKMNPENPLPTGTKYNIYSAVLEDNVNYGNNTSNSRMSVLRFKPYSDYFSNEPNRPNLDINTDFIHTVEVPNSINFQRNDTSNIKIVVWIQKYSDLEESNDRFSREVYQSATNKMPVILPGIGGPVGVAEIENQAQAIIDAKLYPNPAYDMFTVDFDQSMLEDCNWTLLDMRGVVLQQGKLPAGDTQMQVHTADYPAGMYSLRIDHPKFYIYKKVVLLRP